MRRLRTLVLGQPEAAAAVTLTLVSAVLIAWLGAGARTFTIDSYYYLAKAARFSSGLGLTVPWNDGIDRRFFWGYSIVLALPVRVFGERGFWILAGFLQLWTGFSAWRLLSRLGLASGVRLAALALTLFNPIVLWWSTVPASEQLFAALALASIERAVAYAQSAKATDLLTAAAWGGLTLLTRAEGVALAPVLLYLVRRHLRSPGALKRLAACVALFVLPEATHLAYLAWHAVPGTGTTKYVDDIRRHFAELDFVHAFWTNLRAPFWAIFRDDTEGWLYARFFPALLTEAQTVIAYGYVGILLGAILAGVLRRGVLFKCAVALALYAVAHAFWYYLYERFSYAVVPAAALVVAGSVAVVVHRVAPRRAGVLTAVVGCALASVCAVYGTRVSQMHAERLTLHEDGRNYRELGAQVSALNTNHEPIATDMGPYLAWYLNGWSYFLNDTEFYKSAVPECAAGREFLARNHVRAIVSSGPADSLPAGYGLAPAAYTRLQAAASVLLLNEDAATSPQRPPGPPLDLPGGAEWGERVRLERVRVEPGSATPCATSRVTLSFRASAPLEADFMIFVHVEDPEGKADRFNVDHSPTGNPRATTWKAGEEVLDQFEFSLPARYPGHRVRVWGGFWDGKTDRRLGISNPGAVTNDGNGRVLLAELPVRP